ncbi:hypothetical protein [Actinoallomurus sp. NPDC052274]|uniref:hypothetical protein n=1 Tax=Actinoallomurus sp. NPDC052274 TaxID=3155420 RepID=UPI003418D3A1
MTTNVVTPANLVQGPADVYAGGFGATEPADSAVATAPGAGWTGVGGTQGGVTAEIDNTYDQLTVDQLVDPVGARLTKRQIQVTLKLAEATLENLNLVLNNLLTMGSGTGYATADLQTTTSATQPTYAALLIDGWAPALATGAAARRRIIVRKVLSQAKVQFSYQMQNNNVYDCTLTAFYVSQSISPIHIVDQTA